MASSVPPDSDGDGTPDCLLAHWKFDGNALDALGGIDGEEMYSVTYLPGPSGQAVDLVSTAPSKSHVRVASDAPT